jgi:hypothetical protein
VSTRIRRRSYTPANTPASLTFPLKSRRCPPYWVIDHGDSQVVGVQHLERSAAYSPSARGYGRIRPVIESVSATFPATTGVLFWRDRTVDLLLVASSGCTLARHYG